MPDVEAYPGHIGQLSWQHSVPKLTRIACDGDTKSEIVIPLIVNINGQRKTIGVFDLDSTKLATFDDDDLAGLSRIVDIVAEGSDWS